LAFIGYVYLFLRLFRHGASTFCMAWSACRSAYNTYAYCLCRNKFNDTYMLYFRTL